MPKIPKLTILLVSPLTLILISGCSRSVTLKAQKYPAEIARLEASLPKTEDANSKANLHLRLGLLHLSPDNPNPDYAAALKELDKYATLDPEDGKRDEIRGLLTVLRVLKKSAEENRTLRVKMEQLIHENQEIKKALEQLKSLDMDIEKRRKEIR